MLTDLRASTLNISGHDQTLHTLFPSGGGQLTTSVRLSPDSVLSNQLSLHEAMPELDEDDRKLVGLRVAPFANQLVSTQFSVSHAALDRISRRSAGLVFVMGLLATAAVVVMTSRSEHKLRGLNQALRQRSRTDGLTRIAHRRASNEALALEEKRRQRHGHSYGLVVDLDGFKLINDQEGHQIGDHALQITATQLASQLRNIDLLARVGGDEFALSEAHVSLDQAWAKADGLPAHQFHFERIARNNPLRMRPILALLSPLILVAVGVMVLG